jgi:hypothetical protein
MRPRNRNRHSDSRGPQLLSTEMQTETATTPQTLSTSDSETSMNPRAEESATNVNPQMQEVVKVAGEDLRQLLRQRAEITKRIRTLKQTIEGLARLLGDDWFSEELLELVGRKVRRRQLGLTKSCRTVLMEANRPLDAHEVCELVRRRIPLVFLNHKSPANAVTTVLNRLVEYREALAVRDENGRRAWRSCSQNWAKADAD